VLALGRELLGGSYAGARVCALGAAFKPNTDDVRDSPALAVACAADREGARVVVHDPVAVDCARRAHPDLAYADSIFTAARDADLLLLLTDWTEFEALDPTVLGSLVRRRNLVDARNLLPPARWSAAGWAYRA
jgi:UDPglucose 6-dehydrogenase